MNKFFLLGWVALSLFSCKPTDSSESQTNSMTMYTFLVGTYPDRPQEGIYRLTFDPVQEKLHTEILFDSIQNPSFVIADASGQRIFAVEETEGELGGQVISYAQNSEGVWTQLSKVSSKGGSPCYLALSPDEKHLTVGNYSGGNFSLYRVSESGNLTHLQTINHSGNSVNKARQEAAHVHSTVFSPDGTHLLVSDLGTDEIRVYRFDPNEATPLTLDQVLAVSPGDGPRHLVFSPNGSEIAALQELSGAINIYSYTNHKYSLTSRISYLESGFDGAIGGAEVRYSPDGKFLLASNRGDANSLTVFAKNAKQDYEQVQVINSGGKGPRNFAMTADGKYLLAAQQGSNEVVVFRRDLDSGRLEQIPARASITKPVYLFELSN